MFVKAYPSMTVEILISIITIYNIINSTNINKKKNNYKRFNIN